MASSTIDMLRRKVQNLEDENVNLKVCTFSFNIGYRQVSNNTDICKACGVSG